MAQSSGLSVPLTAVAGGLVALMSTLYSCQRDDILDARLFTTRVEERCTSRISQLQEDLAFLKGQLDQAKHDGKL